MLRSNVLIIFFITTGDSPSYAYNRPNLTECAEWSSHATTITNEAFPNARYTALFIDNENTMYAVDAENEQLLIWPNRSSTSPRNISNTMINPLSLYVDMNSDEDKNIDKWILNSTSAEFVIRVNSSCTHIFIDQNKTLYCSMTEFHLVIKTDLTSIHTNNWIDAAGTGCPGPTQTMLDHPHGIVADDNNGLYVADTYNDRIQYFSFGETYGRTVAGFGSENYLALKRPSAIQLDGANCLYIVDSLNHRIIRLIEQGFVCILGCLNLPANTENQLHYPYLMSFDKDGNIVLIDLNYRRMRFFKLLRNWCTTESSVACTTYTTINDASRSIDYTSSVTCDNRTFDLSGRWVRFLGSAGTIIPTKATNPNTCGTHASGWYNGVMPSVGHITNGTVCYSFDGNTCRWSNKNEVANCNTFYVYRLFPLPICSLRYCVTNTNTTVKYNQVFTGGGIPTSQCTNWNNFRSSLVAEDYSSLAISGSNNLGGIILSDSIIVAQIAAALRTGTPFGPVSANGYSWMIGKCNESIEFTSTGSVCNCSNGYTVRPCMGNTNWGGINGPSCNGSNQVMRVTFATM